MTVPSGLNAPLRLPESAAELPTGILFGDDEVSSDGDVLATMSDSDPQEL